MKSSNDPLDQELRALFREMSDAELVTRCSSDTLTEQAQALALKELTQRGLSLPASIATANESNPYEGDFETVARYINATDAHLMRACLEAAGLPAIVADANLVQIHSLWAIALGGARVLVPSSRVAEAQEVIAAFARGDLALPDDTDWHRE